MAVLCNILTCFLCMAEEGWQTQPQLLNSDLVLTMLRARPSLIAVIVSRMEYSRATSATAKVRGVGLPFLQRGAGVTLLPQLRPFEPH